MHPRSSWVTRIGRFNAVVLPLVFALACADDAAEVTAPVATIPPGVNGAIVGKPTVFVSALDPDMCLGIAGEIKRGADASLQVCDGGPAQQFTYDAESRLIKIGGLCLDVSDEEIRYGDPVGVWTCHGGKNQRWALPTGDTGELRSMSRCLTVVSRSGSLEGRPIVQVRCSGSSTQRFTQKEVGTTPPTTPEEPPTTPEEPPPPSDGTLGVVPGLAGFGVETRAGRGGQVLRVTNLNDGGAGSLRAALAAS
ncbi:MAG TPA: RICIN domain-containing protein, partial [Gemmatimonadaceae bacterium]|nr:RICIN domain-containing protein [Gemmatimonadaceae bacterium]